MLSLYHTDQGASTNSKFSGTHGSLTQTFINPDGALSFTSCVTSDEVSLLTIPLFLYL